MLEYVRLVASATMCYVRLVASATGAMFSIESKLSLSKSLEFSDFREQHKKDEQTQGSNISPMGTPQTNNHEREDIKI